MLIVLYGPMICESVTGPHDYLLVVVQICQTLVFFCSELVFKIWL